MVESFHQVKMSFIHQIANVLKGLVRCAISKKQKIIQPTQGNQQERQLTTQRVLALLVFLVPNMVI
jgi:hypothetical protein